MSKKTITTPKVHILLSTYNGERYLDEQLMSIFKQQYKSFIVHIRDDGSNDKTPDIIQEWELNHPNQVQVYIENNIGVIQSFISLLKKVKIYNKNDFFAFCDQDDYWYDTKLERAVQHLLSSPEPEKNLYCSNLEYVDDTLNHISYSPVPQKTNFNNAVVENIAVGCTVVFGSTIKEHLNHSDPKYMMMHDWWAYLLATSYGKVFYDKTPTIKYRQHKSSVTDWEPGLKKALKRAKTLFKKLKSKNHYGMDSLNQATHFIKTNQNIPSVNKEIVNELLELRKKGTLTKRLKYILNSRVYRTSTIENFLLKLMILFKLH